MSSRLQLAKHCYRAGKLALLPGRGLRCQQLQESGTAPADPTGCRRRGCGQPAATPVSRGGAGSERGAAPGRPPPTPGGPAAPRPRGTPRSAAAGPGRAGAAPSPALPSRYFLRSRRWTLFTTPDSFSCSSFRSCSGGGGGAAAAPPGRGRGCGAASMVFPLLAAHRPAQGEARAVPGLSRARMRAPPPPRGQPGHGVRVPAPASVRPRAGSGPGCGTRYCPLNFPCRSSGVGHSAVLSETVRQKTHRVSGAARLPL